MAQIDHATVTKLFMDYGVLIATNHFSYLRRSPTNCIRQTIRSVSLFKIDRSNFGFEQLDWGVRQLTDQKDFFAPY